MTDWPARAAPPELAPGEVHVWALRLDVPDGALRRLRSSLSAGERARADRLAAPPARRRAAAARGLLRLLLGAYAGAPPHALPLAAAAQGKPYLAGPDAGGLRFNLAHSDDLGLLAVARGVEVGVDVERLREVADAAELASRYFAADEADALAALPAGRRHEAFLRCWTCKEAVLKAAGTGLTGGLARVRVAVDATAPPRVLAAPAGAWSLHALEPETGYVGALAVGAAACRLRRLTLAL